MKCVISKKNMFLFLVLLLLLGCLIGGYFWYQHRINVLKEEKIKEIQSHYGSYVLANPASILYEKKDDSFYEVGEIFLEQEFSLDDYEVNQEENNKFPIAGTPYYLSYDQVKPVETRNLEEMSPFYLPFEQKLTTKEITHLYQENQLKITLNKSITLDILFATDSYYRVSFLGNYYDIKKEEVVIEPLESTTKEADYISVVQFSKYEENCKSNTCVSKEKIEEILKQWQDNGNYSITESEYLSWLNGYLRLKPGAIVITLVEPHENFQQSFERYGFDMIQSSNLTFVNNDCTTRKDTKKESVNRYVLHQNMNSEQLKKVMDGVTIEKPKPPVVTSGKSLPSLDAKASSIAVLNYHFFYDASLGETCNEGNCLEVKKFREQLDYLKNNHYKTLTMEEYRAWMYGEIELPARSVLLTVDDGAMGTGVHNGNKLIPILEEYQMHATLFLISGWWSIENYRSPYLDIESHTYDMHTEGLCKNQPRGAKLLCSSREQMLEDMKKSLSITGSNKAFCFPFYAYNDVAIQGLKEVGFQLGFIGGYAKSNRNQDKYKITRYPVHSNTTLNQFIQMIH